MTIVAISALSCCVVSVYMVILLPMDLQGLVKFAEEKGRFLLHCTIIWSCSMKNSILERMKDVTGEIDLQEWAGKLWLLWEYKDFWKNREGDPQWGIWNYRNKSFTWTRENGKEQLSEALRLVKRSLENRVFPQGMKTMRSFYKPFLNFFSDLVRINWPSLYFLSFISINS